MSKPKFDFGQKMFSIYNFDINEVEVVKIDGTKEGGWKYHGPSTYINDSADDSTAFHTRKEAEQALKELIDTEVESYRRKLEGKNE